MGLGEVGKNATTEFFEDLVYSVAYDEIIPKLNKFINTGNEHIDDALKSSINIIFSGAMMLYLAKQEQFVFKIFNKVKIAVVVYLALPLRNKLINKVKSKRGKKLLKFLDFFSSSDSDNINKARMAVDIGKMYIGGDGNCNTIYHSLNSYYSSKSDLVNQDNHKLNYAKAKASMVNQQMLFKLFTKKFTPADKEMIRKMTGNTNIDIDTLNHIADFMFVTDNTGEITGLSEQFMRFINGLGYTNNKGAKNG